MSKIVAIIPARRNSRRLPQKNWKLLLDKPLICYTIEEAIKCKFIDEILISTDSPEIVELCQKYTYDKRITLIDRPAELATSEAKTEDVIIHALKETQNYDWLTTVILLQPTSPLRTSVHITEAYNFYELYPQGITLVSVREGDQSINGAIYIFQRELKYPKHKLTYEMTEDESCDIDTLSDFEWAESLLLERLNKKEVLK